MTSSDPRGGCGGRCPSSRMPLGAVDPRLRQVAEGGHRQVYRRGLADGQGSSGGRARRRRWPAFVPPSDAQGVQPWRPDSTTHAFQRASGEAGVPVIPFHYVRHACASWLLAGGADVVAVSQQLGHWSPAFTLTTYAHAMPGGRSASWPAPSAWPGLRLITRCYPANLQGAARGMFLQVRHTGGGSSVGQSRGLIIPGSQVRVLPAPRQYCLAPPDA